VPLAEKAKIAARLCRQLSQLSQPGAEPIILRELSGLYPFALFHLDFSGYYQTDNYPLSVVYLSRQGGSVAGGLRPRLPKVLQYQASWIARLDDRGPDLAALLWEKSRLFDVDNEVANVMHFQRMMGLAADGIVGAATGKAMRDLAKELQVDLGYGTLRKDRPPRPRTRWERILLDELESL
jgi:hypothetical protein